MMVRVAAATAALGMFLGFATAADAKPTVIATLGTAPLIGQIASTEQMQHTVAVRGDILAKAGTQLGLTSAQFKRFQVAVANGDAKWVEIPRQLDAMSWSAAGIVHVIRNVVIPANTHGWEVDLPESDHIVAVYMPAICGNLSLLRKPMQRVAAAPVRRAVAPRPPVAVMAPPPPAPVEAPAPAPVVAEAPPTPTPVIDVPAPKKNNVGLFGLLIPFLFGGGGGGGSSGSGPSGGPLPCP